MSDKTTQKAITVGDGDVVAGNKTSSTNFNYYGPVSQITHLSNDYENELKESSPEISSYLPELKHYMSAITSEQVQGLQEKLTDANRTGEIFNALRQKELFSKQLSKHSTSKTAQKIYLYLLGDLLSRFRAYVKPIIDSGEPIANIERAVFEHVVSPTVQGLERNVLELYHEQIWGMIYYLTGNCHIRWNKEC